MKNKYKLLELNYRPLILYSIFIILSILITFLLFIKLLLAILLFVSIIVLFIYLIYNYLAIKNYYKFIHIIIIIFLSFIVFVKIFYTIKNYSPKLISQYNNTLLGKIKFIDNVNEENIKFEINNVVLNEKKIKGNILITLSYDENSDVFELANEGDTVILSKVYLSYVNLIDNNSINDYMYKKSIRYYAKSDAKNGQLIRKNNNNIFIILRKKIKKILYQNLNQNNASLLYSMLVGDTTKLDKSVWNSYRISGICHILAVSGLHLSIIILIITFILKKLKINKYLYVLISSLLIILYAGIAYFTPSVIRATIMSILFIIASKFGKWYDSFSSMLFAFLLILLFKPLYLFSVSFLMSFCAVFGIICLYSKANNFLQKTKLLKILPKKIKSSLALSISAQIGIEPMILLFFNTFETYAIITNVILLPIILLIFIYCFILTFITFIFPYTKFLFKIIEIPINLINKSTATISSFYFSNLYIYPFAILIIISLFLILLASKYNLFNQYKQKAFIVFISLAIILLFIPSPNIIKSNSLIAYENNIILYNKKYTTLIYDNSSVNSLSYSFKKMRINKINNLVIINQKINYSTIKTLKDNFNIKTLIIADDFYETVIKKNITTLFKNIIILNDDFINLKNCIVKEIDSNKTFLGYEIFIDDLNILITKTSATQINELGSKFLNSLSILIDKNPIELINSNVLQLSLNNSQLTYDNTFYTNNKITCIDFNNYKITINDIYS